MAYTPPEYPGDIPEFAEVWPPVDDVNWMYTSAWDALVKEVRAIMAELGIDPAGAHATVVARLDAMGVGDVVGPGSALDEAIVRYNGTSGKLIQATLGAKIDDTGRLTNTTQPCFRVKNTTDQLNLAVGAAVTIVFGTEIFDIGNNFAANTFTAPVTGKYIFSAYIIMENIDVDANYYLLRVVKGGTVYYITYFTPGMFAADFTLPYKATYIISMSANDTIHVEFYQSGGAQQTDIGLNTCFMGGLLY